jgi:hypothetical protein
MQREVRRKRKGRKRGRGGRREEGEIGVTANGDPTK